jgi:hypothetical protein
MGVPEATIYEHGHVPAWKDEIRLARRSLRCRRKRNPIAWAVLLTIISGAVFLDLTCAIVQERWARSSAYGDIASPPCLPTITLTRFRGRPYSSPIKMFCKCIWGRSLLGISRQR